MDLVAASSIALGLWFIFVQLSKLTDVLKSIHDDGLKINGTISGGSIEVFTKEKEKP